MTQVKDGNNKPHLVFLLGKCNRSAICPVHTSRINRNQKTLYNCSLIDGFTKANLDDDARDRRQHKHWRSLIPVTEFFDGPWIRKRSIKRSNTSRQRRKHVNIRRSINPLPMCCSHSTLKVAITFLAPYILEQEQSIMRLLKEYIDFRLLTMNHSIL